MLTVKEMYDKLQHTNLTKAAEVTGISYVTLSMIKKGTNTNPTYSTGLKLTEYFNDQP